VLATPGPWSAQSRANPNRLNLPLKKKETIMSILKTRVRARGADKAEVEDATAAAKASCPISKVLKLEIILGLTVEL